MKGVTDMPKDELQAKLQLHIDDARLAYQTALLDVCVHGVSRLPAFKKACENFTDLAKCSTCLAGE